MYLMKCDIMMMIFNFLFSLSLLFVCVCVIACRTETNEYWHVTEEEKKINSLKESHEWDSSEAKDQLSLSSTSLPDVGIHEPEFHVKGELIIVITFLVIRLERIRLIYSHPRTQSLKYYSVFLNRWSCLLSALQDCRRRPAVNQHDGNSHPAGENGRREQGK